MSVADVAKSVVVAASSSRFIDPNFWRDPASGNGFQIQVEIPQNRVRSIEDLNGLRLSSGGPLPQLRDVADVKFGTTMGEVDRYNIQRVVSLTANLHGEYRGDAAKQIQQALARVGNPPRGVTVAVRGQIPPLEETIGGLRIGLLLSILVIFLLLTFNFQSLRLSLAILLTIPAVLCGVLIMLFVTRTTLNVQSFMGTTIYLLPNGIVGSKSHLTKPNQRNMTFQGVLVLSGRWLSGNKFSARRHVWFICLVW